MVQLTGDHRFRPHERLRSSREYARVRKEGKRLRTRHFTIGVVINDLPHHRLGMVVQKRFWNAVRRNAIKRRLREWFRLNKYDIPTPGRDVVVVARPGAEKLSPERINSEILSAMAGRKDLIR